MVSIIYFVSDNKLDTQVDVVVVLIRVRKIVMDIMLVENRIEDINVRVSNKEIFHLLDSVHLLKVENIHD